MVLRRIGFVLAAAVFSMAAGARDASALNTCTIGNHGPQVMDAQHPYYTEAECPNGNPCGCAASGSGCIFKLTQSYSTSSSATCLTLGPGVTFDMDGHSLTCSGSDCGYAIENTASSGGASNKVLVKNGTISGCFDAGLAFNTSGGTNTNSSVADMLIDLGNSCTNGLFFGNGDYFNIGIYNPITLVSRVRVHHTDIGVYGSSGADIEDSALTDNVVGMTQVIGSIDNVLFSNNAYHLWKHKTTFVTDIAGSSFTGATSCNCAYTPSGASNAKTCQSNLTVCGTFQAPPSHVCNPSDTADECTIQQ